MRGIHYKGIVIGLLLASAQTVWALDERGVSAGEMMRNAGVAAAVLAIMILLGTEFIFRKRLALGTYHWLLFMGILFLPALTLLGTHATIMDETKKVNSCNQCHIMHPFVDDLLDPDSATLAARHFKNRWIPYDQCYACHTTYGIHGTMEAKRDGFRHWLLYVTGTWEEPITYKGSFPNISCLECHIGTPKYDAVPSHHALSREFLADSVGCFTCHGPAHPTPLERTMVQR